MAGKDEELIVLTKPGLIAFGTGLPPESSIQSFCQDETIVYISCGHDHTTVVYDSGKIYCFGMDNGWLKNGSDTVAEPMLVAKLAIRVTQASCGQQFTVFLTDKGELYSCGVNVFGQLGLGHTNKSPFPVLVTGLPPIKKVAAGGFHTVALACSGEIWATGYNTSGQLGLGHKNTQISFASVLNLPESIIDISCGGLHTALLSKSRILLMSGANEKGQLGLSTVNCMDSFTQVSIPSSPVVSVSCGYYHTVALRVDRTVWSWGSNAYNQLGTGKSAVAHTFIPTQMIGLEKHIISEVIAGCNHTALLTKEGDVLVCGYGESGQLGQGKENLFVATLLPKSPDLTVKQIAFADKGSLILVVPKSTTARGCMTDLERNIMRSLECPVCFKIMCAPIHLCFNGHSLCNACRSHKDISVCPLCRGIFTNARNIVLESQSLEIQLPCVECLQRMPTCELEKHGEFCPNRKYSCPVQQSCGWSGRPDTMLAHTSSAHPGQTWRDLPHTFLHSTSDELVHTDVLAAHNEVFTLHRRYNMTTGEFQASVRCTGQTVNKEDYMLEFTFVSENEEIIICRVNICDDIVTILDTFQSSNCVCMERESVSKFFHQGQLMCRATILKVGTGVCAD